MTDTLLPKNEVPHSVCITEGCDVKILRGTDLCPTHRAIKEYDDRLPKNDEDQHQRSVETLSLSGHGDTRIIPELYKWCMDNDIVLSTDQAVSLSDFIQARDTKMLEQAVEKSRSFCGCLMCEHHSSAYELHAARKESK